MIPCSSGYSTNAGCGQLFRFGELRAGVKPGYAEDLRTYLCLEDQRQQRRLEAELGIELASVEA